MMDGATNRRLGGRGAGVIVAFDLATGQQKWNWPQEGPEDASPVVMTVDGTKQIVTLTERSVVGVRATDGQQRIDFDPAFVIQPDTDLLGSVTQHKAEELAVGNQFTVHGFQVTCAPSVD
jgi:hypothetical protein